MSPPLRSAMSLSLFLVGSSAAAQEETTTSSVPMEVTATADAPRTFVSLRGGVTTVARRPEICLEVSPLEFISVEACGTGSGFLHRDRAAAVRDPHGGARLLTVSAAAR